MFTNKAKYVDFCVTLYIRNGTNTKKNYKLTYLSMLATQFVGR